MSAPVVVRELRKRYGVVEAVCGVSFDVNAGEIFGLLGPNGAGKTTTLECLTGLREPDAGVIEIGGVELQRDPRAIKARIGVALQATALPDQITAREALELFGALYPRRHPADALLARFGLADKAGARFAALSGGQRQRLALALAFVNQPDVVVLDEPTTGLDPQSRHELHVAIRALRHEGHTVLLSTHYLDEAEDLCDRVAILHHGNVVAAGTPGELTAQSHAHQSVRLLTTLPLRLEDVARLPAVQTPRCDGVTAEFTTPDATTSVAALMDLVHQRGAELLELHVRKATLEQVFLGLTRSDDSEPRAT